MNDIGIVPHTVGRQRDAHVLQSIVGRVIDRTTVIDGDRTNLHSVGAYRTGQHRADVVRQRISIAVVLVAVIGQAVAADQRAPVVTVQRQLIDQSRRATGVGQLHSGERVDIDVDRHILVIADDVVDDHRLCPADKNRRPFVDPASKAVTRALAARANCVLLDHTVGDPRIGLMDFDDIEGREGAFDLVVVAATEGDVGLIQIQLAQGSGPNAAPIAARGTGLVRPVILIRIERPAGTVLVIQLGREDDLPVLQALGDQLGAESDLDAGAFQFNHGARVDFQTSVKPRADHAGQPRIQRQGLALGIPHHGPVVDEVRPSSRHLPNQYIGPAAAHRTAEHPQQGSDRCRRQARQLDDSNVQGPGRRRDRHAAGGVGSRTGLPRRQVHHDNPIGVTAGSHSRNTRRDFQLAERHGTYRRRIAIQDADS